jgi:hypothetical protein
VKLMLVYTTTPGSDMPMPWYQLRRPCCCHAWRRHDAMPAKGRAWPAAVVSAVSRVRLKSKGYNMSVRRMPDRGCSSGRDMLTVEKTLVVLYLAYASS